MFSRKISTSSNVSQSSNTSQTSVQPVATVQVPPPVVLPEPAPAPLIDSSLIVEHTPDGEWSYDPNEPRYCICNQVSYGDMVACDNEAVRPLQMETSLRIHLILILVSI